MPRVGIFHGTKGSSQGNWFPWLASQLRDKGYKAIVPEFPTPENQTLENWFKVFDEIFGELHSTDILVGHSIGAVFVLRVLERSEIRINHAILVSGLTGLIGIAEYDHLNSTFVSTPFQWAKIRSCAEKFCCVQSDDDPYVPIEQSRSLASNLGIEPIVMPKGKHLNAEAGFTEFPLLVDVVTEDDEKTR